MEKRSKVLDDAEKMRNTLRPMLDILPDTATEKAEILGEFRSLLQGHKADPETLGLLMKDPIFHKFAQTGEVDSETLRGLVHNPGQFRAYDAVFGEQAMDWVRERRHRISELFDPDADKNPTLREVEAWRHEDLKKTRRLMRLAATPPSNGETEQPGTNGNGDGKRRGGKRTHYPRELRSVITFLVNNGLVQPKELGKATGISRQNVDGWLKHDARKGPKKAPQRLPDCMTWLDGVTPKNPDHIDNVVRTRDTIRRLMNGEGENKN